MKEKKSGNKIVCIHIKQCAESGPLCNDSECKINKESEN